MKRLPAILILGLAAAGCVGPGSRPGVPAPPSEVPPVAPPVTPAPPEPPAVAPAIVTALLDEAARFERAGSDAEAAAAIEQAIRIEPRRGELWLQLAAIRLRIGRPVLAEQSARKGLSFAPPGSGDERVAWLLIAAARAALGDQEAAREIRDRWQ